MHAEVQCGEHLLALPWHPGLLSCPHPSCRAVLLCTAASIVTIQQIPLVEGAPPADPALEQTVACQLQGYLQQRLAAYKNPLWRDLEILEDPASTPRQKVGALGGCVCVGFGGGG